MFKQLRLVALQDFGVPRKVFSDGGRIRGKVAEAFLEQPRGVAQEGFAVDIAAGYLLGEGEQRRVGDVLQVEDELLREDFPMRVDSFL